METEDGENSEDFREVKVIMQVQKTMEKIIDASLELGINVLTLYAFSSENWKRPKEEVNYLMDLPARYFKEKLPVFMEKDIKIVISGDIAGLPEHTRKAVEGAIKRTARNRSLIVNFALNYGGRNEIVSAVKLLLQDIHSAKRSPKDINESTFEQYLYTRGLPDPDILIRTGGEERLSNFLLWQSSKADMWFTDTLFPDFTKDLLIQAIKEVSERKEMDYSEEVLLVD